MKQLFRNATFVLTTVIAPPVAHAQLSNDIVSTTIQGMKELDIAKQCPQVEGLSVEMHTTKGRLYFDGIRELYARADFPKVDWQQVAPKIAPVKIVQSPTLDWIMVVNDPKYQLNAVGYDPKWKTSQQETPIAEAHIGRVDQGRFEFAVQYESYMMGLSGTGDKIRDAKKILAACYDASMQIFQSDKSFPTPNPKEPDGRGWLSVNLSSLRQ